MHIEPGSVAGAKAVREHASAASGSGPIHVARQKAQRGAPPLATAGTATATCLLLAPHLPPSGVSETQAILGITLQAFGVTSAPAAGLFDRGAEALPSTNIADRPKQRVEPHAIACGGRTTPGPGHPGTPSIPKAVGPVAQRTPLTQRAGVAANRIPDRARAPWVSVADPPLAPPAQPLDRTRLANTTERDAQ